jgi:glycosyltransferase involved in cell wall biosynthesis
MTPPFLNVTVPVYNGEKILGESIRTISAFLVSNCPFAHEIVIAENGSTDRTLEIARQLERDIPQVRVLHREQKGRGGAIKAAWQQSEAQILSYMDVDLSSDLTAFPTLIDAVWHKGFHLATGSRLLNKSSTTRGFKRELISRCYNFLVKASFRTAFSDAQCGFKAITKVAGIELLPLVEDNGWFMDTELLILAERLGYRIFDLPVRWTDNADSRVRLWSTAAHDIRGLMRLRRNFSRQKYQLRPVGEITRLTSP